eukprot:57772-Chlamydomonas_euryale.AAC.1
MEEAQRPHVHTTVNKRQPNPGQVSVFSCTVNAGTRQRRQTLCEGIEADGQFPCDAGWMSEGCRAALEIKFPLVAPLHAPKGAVAGWPRHGFLRRINNAWSGEASQQGHT